MCFPIEFSFISLWFLYLFVSYFFVAFFSASSLNYLSFDIASTLVGNLDIISVRYPFVDLMFCCCVFVSHILSDTLFIYVFNYKRLEAHDYNILYKIWYSNNYLFQTSKNIVKTVDRLLNVDDDEMKKTKRANR